jgi:hypothetical protein
MKIIKSQEELTIGCHGIKIIQGQEVNRQLEENVEVVQIH